MRKFLHSPLFRCLTCIILICCILLNTSPIRSEASAIVVGATVSAAGVFATLFAMAMGVVFVDLTADLINGLGDSFVNHISNNTSSDQQSEKLKVWIEPLQVDLNSGDISQIPPEDDNNPWGALAGLFSIPDELKSLFISWVKDIVTLGKVDIDVEVEEPSPDYTTFEGWGKYYEYQIDSVAYTLSVKNDGDFILPVYFTDPNFVSLYLLSSSSYAILNGVQKRSSVQLTSGSLSFYRHFITSFRPEEHTWSGPFAYGGTDAGNFDLSLIEPPSDNADTGKTTVPVYPDTYVGDIPQKIQNGDFDDDDLELPYIDPTKLWENQTDAIEALNNTATQLQNQTMTYPQYMDKITQNNSGSNPDPSVPNPSTPIDPSVPADIADYTFDLRDIFPFCIPFDLYDFFACLDAPPEAPVINWEIYLPGGGVCPITLDLSYFDEVAQLLRRLELLLFCIGLAFKTRDLIKG